jgi:hypothetical protein
MKIRTSYGTIIDDDDILKDGESVRVPMMLCDATQRDVARARRLPLIDAHRHRPGVRTAPRTDAARLRDAAFADMERSLGRAWMRDVHPAYLQAHVSGLNSAAADLQGKLDQDEADRVEKALERSRAEDAAPPDPEAEREAYKVELSNAWKQPMGTPVICCLRTWCGSTHALPPSTRNSARRS